MRFKGLAYIFIAATIFAMFAIAQPNPVHAQTQTGAGLSDGGPATSPQAPAGAFEAAVRNEGRLSPQQDIGCSFTSMVGFSICLSNVVYVFTVGIGSSFAYVAAMFFDFAIFLSLHSGAYGLDFISTGWELARDLANMAFIFILIYLALTIMLKAETGGTIKTLALVIVIAALVNFSFFFTRVVIDAGNLLAVQFYNAIPAQPIGQTQAGSGINPATSNQVTLASNATAYISQGQAKDLTHGIMQMMDLGKLFQTDTFKAWATDQSNGFLTGFITLSFLYIAAGIFFWMLVVTFITVGIKFLVRIVVLWFLIIASPLAFVAKAIDKFGSLYDRWQSELIKHSMYPAVFMFVFYILTIFSGQLSAGTGAAGGNAIIQGIFTGGINNKAPAVEAFAMSIANVAIRLGFVIAVLYIGLRAADYIGVMGAKFAENMGKRAGRAFAHTSIGSAAWLGRNTAGWGAQRLIDRKGFQNLAARNALVRGTLWRGAQKTATASFDARMVAPKGADVYIGKAGGKKGYRGQEEERIKMRENQAKEFSKLSDEEKQALKAQAQADAKTEHAARRTAKQDEIKSASDALERARGDNAPIETRLGDAKKAHSDLGAEFSKQEKIIEGLKTAGKEYSPEMEEAVKKRGEVAEKLQLAALHLDLRSAEAKESKKALDEAEKNLNAKKAEADVLEKEEEKKAKALEGEYVTKATRGNIFAENIGNPNIIRAWVYAPKADKDAAAKIKKEKSKQEKALDTLKEALEKEGGEEKTDETK